MREIEVKLKVDDLAAVASKLEVLGCAISEPISQKDIIFHKAAEKPPKNILRIREQQGKFIFTFKRNVKDELDCIERETVIADSTALQEIIKLLGFSELARVSKIRRKCSYKDYEICLDAVEGLGSFIEIEKMSTTDTRQVRAEMLAFLAVLGLDTSKQVFQGYDTMLEKVKIKA